MLNDLRYALRTLAKNPGFVTVAILSLAIGIGANSAIYSFANTTLLRPLPVPAPSRVVTVNAAKSSLFGAFDAISYPDYVDLRDHNHTFEGLVASSFSSFGYSQDKITQPRIKFGMYVSGNFFRVLGIEPLVGRSFLPEEDQVAGRNPVAIISHELWVNEFSSNPAVTGRTIQLNGTEFTIVGVAPESFPGLDVVKAALYVPLAMSPALGQTNNLVKRDVRWLTVKGRLKPGVELAQADADISSIAAGLRSTYPKTDENLRLSAKTEFQVRVENSPPDTQLVIMLSVLSLTVLCIACANVGGLLLSRSAVRAREMAVRMAIGGSRAALIRQLFTENLLLALGGAAAGLVIALGAVQFFNTLPIPTDLPIDLTFQLDNRALLFTLALAVASTFIFGLAPALHGTRLDLMKALKERDATASRGSRLWGRNAIVSGQVALSFVLLIMAGVLVAGFEAQLDQGPGFRTNHLQFMSFDPGVVHYSDQQRDLFFKQLLDQARQAPGVRSAVLTSTLPMMVGQIGMLGVVPEGHELKRGETAFTVFDAVVSNDYFKTMAIPLLRGRDFLESDQANTPQVAIVNEEFARHFWPNQEPIGKELRLNDANGKKVRVVGVAKISKYIWISESPNDFVYLPNSQNPQAQMTLVAQSNDANASALVPALEKVVQNLDRNMPVFNVRTMQDLYETRAVVTPRIITRTVAGLGMMALILAVVGLYGVVSYSVSKRSREFGIRMAVGADRWKIVRMVLRQGLSLGSIGLALGLILGFLITRAMTKSFMFAMTLNMTPFVGVSLLLLLAVAISAYAPARRASLIDPIRALRDE